jgi:hypothetical protein
MQQAIITAIGLGVASLLLTASAYAAPCPSDSVQVGSTCVDKYEASVWEIPNSQKNQGLIKKVQRGRAGLGDLTSASALANGVVQRGVAADDYPCSPNGNDCDDIYAVSIPGVKPFAVPSLATRPATSPASTLSWVH